MGRIMSFGQDGRMVADFDKSEHDFLRRYGRTPDEVMAENAKLRELVAQRTARRVIVSNADTDHATGHTACGACGGAIDFWDKWCRHCGARMEDE